MIIYINFQPVLFKCSWLFFFFAYDEQYHNYANACFITMLFVMHVMFSRSFVCI